MENPCDKCLIKVICNSLCPEKINYGTLLREKFSSHLSITKTIMKFYYKNEFKKISTLLDHHINEVENIKSRCSSSK